MITDETTTEIDALRALAKKLVKENSQMIAVLRRLEHNKRNLSQQMWTMVSKVLSEVSGS